ncbi:hypothetical protein CSQ_0101 [Campylobacter jejuni subsp. jejuni DFVF1099]|nr:hypothetical protein CSQ_0101 [Campylobacter jejuni subsp. jejuni DFVF1099]
MVSKTTSSLFKLLITSAILFAFAVAKPLDSTRIFLFYS